MTPQNAHATFLCDACILLLLLLKFYALGSIIIIIIIIINRVYFSTRSTRKKMKTVGNLRVKNNGDG